MYKLLTFGANRIRLKTHNLQDRVEEINAAGVKIAREVTGERGFVAGSIGPTGVGLEGLAGDLGKSVIDAFAEQIDCLCSAGVDCLILETFDVLQELELATEIARSHTIPIVNLMMERTEKPWVAGSPTTSCAPPYQCWC